MDTMQIYNKFKTTPPEAQKKITGGRINGFTDINPMYRIRCLTEQFGTCGIGWYYTIDKKWTEAAGDEILAFVDISLYIKQDEWSKPIHGTGGSMMLVKESKGLRASDEAYKMATTDALSVACKQLGIGADIYWAAGESKYSHAEDIEERKSATRTERVNGLCKEHGIGLDTFSDILSSLKASGEVVNKTTAQMTESEFGVMLSLVHTALLKIKKTA